MIESVIEFIYERMGLEFAERNPGLYAAGCFLAAIAMTYNAVAREDRADKAIYGALAAWAALWGVLTVTGEFGTLRVLAVAQMAVLAAIVVGLLIALGVWNLVAERAERKERRSRTRRHRVYHYPW